MTPRTLAPLDKQTIINSVKKTGKLVIVDEEPKTESASSEIAAIVAEEAFDLLKAPVKRVCAPDTPIPFSPAKEMNMDLAKELGDYLKDVASDAIIRYGDYPRNGGALTVTVILSGLKRVEKVKKFYDGFPEAIEKKGKIEEDIEAGQRELTHASINIPSLL